MVPTCPELIVALRRERQRIETVSSQLEASRRLIDIVLDAAPADVVAAAERVQGS